MSTDTGLGWPLDETIASGPLGWPEALSGHAASRGEPAAARDVTPASTARDTNPEVGGEVDEMPMASSIRADLLDVSRETALLPDSTTVSRETSPLSTGDVSRETESG